MRVLRDIWVGDPVKDLAGLSCLPTLREFGSWGERE